MSSLKTPVYYSLNGNFSTHPIKGMGDEWSKLYHQVSIEKFRESSFIEKLQTTRSVWVMDSDSFVFLLQDSQNGQISGIPYILVLLNNELESIFNDFDLPENVDFLVTPVSNDTFQMHLRLAQKKATKNLEVILHNDRHENLFVKSQQSKLILDQQNGKIVDANHAAAKLFEKDLTEILNRNISDIHPESFNILSVHINQLNGTNKSSVNIKINRNKGEIRELQYRLNRVKIGGRMLILANVDDVTEKGKAYEMYYQQAEMLRNTMESIDDLLFSLNRDGDFIEYYQPSGGMHLTLSSDIFVGKNIYDVGFPLDVARNYLQTIEQVIDEDKPDQIDYYLEAFGSRLWYNAKISPRKNAFGLVDGVTVLCRDVTRQKKTEETLKIARDFYLTLLADFPSMIWKTNIAKRADYFNKTWLEFSGNPLDLEIKTDWVEKIHVADVGNFLTVLNNAYKNKSSFQLEHRIRHHSGEYRWVINAGRPFHNLNGQFAGFIGSCFDISDRRKAEEMMYLQKSAMESALEGILIIEDDGFDYPVIYANTELARLTKKNEADIIGKSFLDVLGCPVDTSIKDNLLIALKDKVSFKGEFYYEMPTDDQKFKWHLLYMAPVVDKEKNTHHFVAVLSDITEAKLVERTLRDKNRQLRKTNEELDSFVYSTSHELRSPLMSVLGLLNLLETDIEKEDRNTYLAMIRESISRLDKIIHDIIDYSRNSRIDVVKERINFNAIIEKVIDNHKYYENYEKVKFKVNVHEGGPFMSDRKRIQIVLNNFISNSLRFHNYNQNEPYIEINVQTTSVNALISIKDNGTGIHEKHMSKIYDMFYRGTDRSKGSGIGLYIVKEIVDKLNGNIHLHSVPEKGTDFTVDLPNFINKNYKMVSISETSSLS